MHIFWKLPVKTSEKILVWKPTSADIFQLVARDIAKVVSYTSDISFFFGSRLVAQICLQDLTTDYRLLTNFQVKHNLL